MDPVALTIGISWIFAGLLCLFLALPLARGRVGRNAFYGVRIGRSLQSDAAWFAINRHFGKRLAVWSIPLIGAGVACLFLPLQLHYWLALTVGLAPLLFILVPAFQSIRFARRFPSSD